MTCFVLYGQWQECKVFSTKTNIRVLGDTHVRSNKTSTTGVCQEEEKEEHSSDYNKRETWFVKLYFE
jgi:hypothetical protein